jgi:quinolinate synthase
MTKFDRYAAEAARKANPSMSIFDTGEMLEPLYEKNGHKNGTIDFDDASGSTVLTVSAYPSAEDDDTVIVQIDSGLFTRLKIVVNDGDLVAIDTEGNATFLTNEVQEAMSAARDVLDEAGARDALIDLLRLLEGND